MFRKILLAGVFALVTSVGAFAADTLAMSLNFYSDKGEVTPVGDLPAGVLMGKKVKFANKKLPGYAWPVSIEIDRAPSIELTFKVKGSGELVISMNPEIWVSGKGIVSRMTVNCTDLVVTVKGAGFIWDGRPAKLPFTFSKWTKAARGIKVENGDTVTIKATFEKVE
ncbi:MAG: hypothetical protein J6Y54_02330 [Lentisphaeria bacterium]|nr:hypothetical protein [Lentisphaeria bacterium]